MNFSNFDLNQNMKKLFFIAIVSFLISSCNFSYHETVKGNGKLKSEERNINDVSRIKSQGFFDVELVQGSPSEVRVEADENLLPYIITENSNGWLVVRAKDNVNLKTNNKVKVIIKTEQVSDIELSGSGNIISEGKFSGSDHLKLSIAGSGNISMDVNTPKIIANINGSGDIELKGETRDESIEIAGIGDYKAEELKAENVNVEIAGSGNVRVYAETKLKVTIAGSGDVYYKGDAEVTKNIAGSGNIKRIE